MWNVKRQRCFDVLQPFFVTHVGHSINQIDGNIDYSEVARRKDPALTDPNLEQAEEDAQDLVGEKRIDGIKKNIPTRDYEFVSNDVPKKGTRTMTTNDLPMGDTSPVGTHQNEIPNPFTRKK